MRRFLATRLSVGSSLVLALTITSGTPGASGTAGLQAAEPSALQPELRAAQQAEQAKLKSAATAAPSIASSTAASEAKTPVKLDVEVTALLRRTALALENRAIEPEEQAGFRALITAGDLLREDKTLAPSERERLRALCRVRLAQAEEVLKRQTAKEAKTDDGKRKVVARTAVLQRTKIDAAPANQTLAQQLPGGLGGGVGFGAGAGVGGQNQGANGIGPAANRASAEELMEIITSSIKPESWEDNGGKGVIRYFQLGHGMVIRATADVHGDLGNLVGQLRK